MTEAEKAAALADEIEAEMDELRGLFANRENDHFSFGVNFSSWDVISRALRLLANEGNAPSKKGNGGESLPSSLRETIASSVSSEGVHSAFRRHSDSREAIKAWDAMASIPGDDWRQIMSAIAYDVADAVLAAISAAGFVILPREPTEEMVEAAERAAWKHIYIGEDSDEEPVITGVDKGMRAALRAALATKEAGR